MYPYYPYNTTESTGTLIVVYLIVLAISIFSLVCMVKIFRKIGYKGWYALCPYYSSFLYYKAVWGDGWKFLLAWIPFYNIYLVIKTVVGLGRSFGKNGWFGLGLVLLSPIFLAILAFGKAEYIGNPYEA